MNSTLESVVPLAMFFIFVFLSKIKSLYPGNLGNSLGWQWTWTGQMETPAIFTLDTLTMGKKRQEACRSQMFKKVETIF